MQNSVIHAVLLFAVVGLAACQPAVPDSGSGVGFADYNNYERSRIDRDAALNRGGSTPPSGLGVPAGLGTTATVAPAASGQPVISGDELRSAGLPTGGNSTALPATSPVSSAPLDATGNTTAPVPVGSGSTGISDEQDFGAVSGRESIESNAERIARQRAAYEVVQPTAVPTRPGSNGPNIVAFALSTTNAVGQKIYNRSGFNAESKFLRACASYPSSDRAQEDFLKNGGPQKDSKGVDPDGDGFACYWDPTPFRKVARN